MIVAVSSAEQPAAIDRQRPVAGELISSVDSLVLAGGRSAACSSALASSRGRGPHGRQRQPVDRSRQYSIPPVSAAPSPRLNRRSYVSHRHVSRVFDDVCERIPVLCLGGGRAAAAVVYGESTPGISRRKRFFWAPCSAECYGIGKLLVLTHKPRRTTGGSHGDDTDSDRVIRETWSLVSTKLFDFRTTSLTGPQPCTGAKREFSRYAVGSRRVRGGAANATLGGNPMVEPHVL